ncbi:hypothetical protein [Leptospira wolffii]|uniref:hypothetical protein n=1 Tax=Leptospira wolffii TaxID=409998 RepID=UPI0002DDB5F4|nr:hypothetical protein [Leptospira wolffii]EPG66455.1 hypothetical protein LEP1GSC061_0110 [Leptospira wolffii serovar Khorat str. Khorat-H2]
MDQVEYTNLNNRYEKQILKIKIIIFILVLSAIILFLPVFLLKEPDGKTQLDLLKIDNLSKIGDYLSGTTGTILSLSGLLLIYLSFLGQRQDILMQQFELKESQKVWQGQQKELAYQNENTQRNRFESTFFNLVGMLYDLQNSYAKGNSAGSDKFRNDMTQLINRYLSVKKDAGAIASYAKDSDFFYLYYNYIAHIMNIVDYVSTSRLERKDQEFYIMTLKNLLSVRELLFIEIASKIDIFRKSNSEYLTLLIAENSALFERWK